MTTQMKILIMGLPGSGKTTLARELAYHFLIPHHNADTVREYTDNWDFSPIGRQFQARYMCSQWGILDFIAPTVNTRSICDPQFVIWMDTIKEGRFEDTNKIFEKPERDEYDIRITKWIGLNQLHSSLEDTNPGIKGILNYLNGPFRKLVKSSSQ